MRWVRRTAGSGAATVLRRSRGGAEARGCGNEAPGIGARKRVGGRSMPGSTALPVCSRRIGSFQDIRVICARAGSRGPSDKAVMENTGTVRPSAGRTGVLSRPPHPAWTYGGASEAASSHGAGVLPSGGAQTALVLGTSACGRWGGWDGIGPWFVPTQAPTPRQAQTHPAPGHER